MSNEAKHSAGEGEGVGEMSELHFQNNEAHRLAIYEPIRVLAVSNGCKPKWYDGIMGWAWHCTCEDKTHYCDQQCSAISLTSAERGEAP